MDMDCVILRLSTIDSRIHTCLYFPGLLSLPKMPIMHRSISPIVEDVFLLLVVGLCTELI